MQDYRERLVAALLGNAVVTVAGTGISRAISRNAQEADWVGLIISGIERVESLDSSAARWAEAQNSSLQLALDESDISLLIGVAGQVAARLKKHGNQPYIDWLRDKVGGLKVRAPELAEAIGSLLTPILTTNYDHLLEQALHRATVNWMDRESMREIFRTESDAIGHLHGDWKNISSVVLSPEDYARILSDDPAQVLETAHYSSKSFLFVGYGDGLKDPNFSNLLHWHRKLFPESRGDHFRLCIDSEFEALTQFHAHDDIRVISYGSAHEDLSAFLTGLRPASQRSKTGQALGRDAVAYAREAIVEQIRAETVIGDSVENIDDRDLSDLTVTPVMLPMPHEQFVNARAGEGKLRPERIDPDSVYLEDKILILAGEELSGVSTALRWIVSNAANIRNRTAPIFVDARNCIISTKPLERQIRTEAFGHGLIPGRKDPLPNFALALDNLKPQITRNYEAIIADIAASSASFIVIGCREGDEGQVLQDLRSVGRAIEIAYIGKLGRGEVQQFARILAPNRPSAICDNVLRVVRAERLPRTPFTVALLVVLMSQGSATAAINNSETAVLEQYVSFLLGRSGPFLDPRHYLDPQNREVVLAQLAKEFVRQRRGAVTEGDAVKLISDYFVSRDWEESATAALENFRAMRLLRVDGNIVQFQQSSYLHLFAAKAATKDPSFLNELLQDPLYFAPIIRHYAALVRDSDDVVLRMKEILEGWTPEQVTGRFYGPVRTHAVADAPESADDSEMDELGESFVSDSPIEEHVAESQTSEVAVVGNEPEYDESSDADRIPFPLDDPSTWPAHTRLSAGLELSSRVLRDSDDLSNLEMKSDVFRLVISRWGYLAQTLEKAGVFNQVSAEIIDLLIRGELVKPEDREWFEEHFSMSLMGFTILRSLISTLASRKLIRTYERVRDEPGIRDDPHSALMLTIFAISVRGAGWTQELLALSKKHPDRWSTVQFVRMLAMMAWEDERLSKQDEEDVRAFLKAGYSQLYRFPNERTKRINIKNYDNRLTKQRLVSLTEIEQPSVIPKKLRL